MPTATATAQPASHRATPVRREASQTAMEPKARTDAATGAAPTFENPNFRTPYAQETPYPTPKERKKESPTPAGPQARALAVDRAAKSASHNEFSATDTHTRPAAANARLNTATPRKN